MTLYRFRDGKSLQRWREAKRRGISIAELIRRILDHWIGENV